MNKPAKLITNKPIIAHSRSNDSLQESQSPNKKNIYFITDQLVTNYTLLLALFRI